MANKRIDTQARIESVRLEEQVSAPVSPDAGYSHIFVKADGLYLVNDSDVEIGPFVATGTAYSGDTLGVFHPYNNEVPTGTNYATLGLRNHHPVLDFDPDTDESCAFAGILPRRYGGGGLTVNIHWAAATSTGTSTYCRWQVAFEAISGQDLDEDGYAAAQSAGGNPNADSGKETVTSVTFTDGAQMDSLAAGGAYRMKVTRDADGTSGTDDMVGDAELIIVEVKES